MKRRGSITNQVGTLLGARRDRVGPGEPSGKSSGLSLSAVSGLQRWRQRGRTKGGSTPSLVGDEDAAAVLSAAPVLESACASDEVVRMSVEVRRISEGVEVEHLDDENQAAARATAAAAATAAAEVAPASGDQAVVAREL